MADLTSTPRVLTIAGSDSGGGAGIQADLKAFARCGVHGMSAITAITAQNTREVSAVHAIPADIVIAQIHAVVSDIGVDAVKVGMLGALEVVHAVAQALEDLPARTPIVVDPVMVAESGASLLEADAQAALVAEVVPQATVLTPNLLEARVLGRQGSDTDGGDAGASGTGAAHEVAHTAPPQADASDEQAEVAALAHAVLSLGSESVVLTGGHRAQAVDLFLERATPEQIVHIPGERHRDGAAHGSGCTHSAVLAAQLALGHTPLEAARVARALAGIAIVNGLREIGEGPGPVDVIELARLRDGGRLAAAAVHHDDNLPPQ